MYQSRCFPLKRSAFLALVVILHDATAFQAPTSLFVRQTQTRQSPSFFEYKSHRLSHDERDFDEQQRKHGRLVPSDASSAYWNDQRYCASDWVHNMRNIQKSAILNDIRGPVIAIFSWSVVVSIIHALLKRSWPRAANYICYSSKPHSLLVSALGMLLVFRTNSAYQRFSEGRKIWEQILSVSRNLSRMTSLYEVDIGPKRKRRILRLLSAFPYLLRDHILEKKTMPTRILRGKNVAQHQQEVLDSLKVDKDFIWSLLPPKTRAKCLQSANPPMWVCDRLSQEFMDVEYNPNFTSRERFAFLANVDKLSMSVGECERIHQTAVPQNYARHALRSLTIWLFTLPFALIEDFGLLTGPVMGMTAWLMFGVYQIGASIEDPFQGSLRLHSLCDAIYQDIMYNEETSMNPRETAFKLQSSDIEGRNSSLGLEP